MVRAVRGAVIVENDPASIRTAVTQLVTEIQSRNSIDEQDIVSIVFSQTADIDAHNPASALRTIGFSAVPLFCTQEPKIIGSPGGIIRVLLTCATEHEKLHPVYLNGAESLRADLFGDAAHS